MGSKILLVDDSQELLDVYVAFLQNTTPYEVRAASSARDALENVRTWRPDIVVTDVIMPDMNGLELITRMRSDIPPPLPMVVAMSGFPDFEREARRRGAQVFQAKPIDTDHLVALIDSLLTDREPPGDLNERTRARRRAASEQAQAAVTATLARRPYFRGAAQVGTRLLSRYFDDADVALLLFAEGGLQVFAGSHARWPVGARMEGVFGYALDVVESGSTLIVPDLAAMPSGTVRASDSEWRLLAAAPVLASEGIAIGALVLAYRRPAPFDVRDLGMLEHVAARAGEVFSGAEVANVLQERGVVRAETWRYFLGCEIGHVRPEQSLVIALASLPAEEERPVQSAEWLQALERAFDTLIERLPPRTLLGRLTSGTLAAYSVGADPVAGERALSSAIASLENEPRACVAMLSTTGLAPTDGGAALLDIAHWLLASAMARGPATALSARITPAVLDRRRDAA